MFHSSVTKLWRADHDKSLLVPDRTSTSFEYSYHDSFSAWCCRSWLLSLYNILSSILVCDKQQLMLDDSDKLNRFRTEELPLRIAMFYSFGQVSGFVGGFLAFAVSFADGHLPGWRWLFIIGESYASSISKSN